MDDDDDDDDGEVQSAFQPVLMREGGGKEDQSYDANGLPTSFPCQSSTLELDACSLQETDNDNNENDRTWHGKAGKAGLATYQCLMGMRVYGH